MNVRKPIDYSAMFSTLDPLMAADLPQMELYCEIGRLVSDRPEKGAAVAAAEYLCAAYPDASGFSPRNLRRMREFYRTYENTPEVLAQAMTIGWTQNIVILENCVATEECARYIAAVRHFHWSKTELLEKITRVCFKTGRMPDWGRFFRQARRLDAGILTDFKSNQRSPGGKRCLKTAF